MRPEHLDTVAGPGRSVSADRILIFIGGIGAVLWLLGLAAGGLRVVLGTGWPSGVANVVLAILAVHFAYRGIVRLLERRSAVELSLSGAPLETGAGALVGAGCLTVTVGMVAALGYYQVQGIGAWASLVTAFGIAATSGYIEEVIFRGGNFMQAGAFGPHVSGRQVESLLQSRMSGPDLLSGGALGVEGSVFAIAVCLLASLVFLTRARRQDLFVRPYWRRRQPEEDDRTHRTPPDRAAVD